MIRSTHGLFYTIIFAGLLFLNGCSHQESTLSGLDRGLRALATSTSPSIVILQTVSDSGTPAGTVGSAVSINSHGELLTTASVLKDGKPLLAKLPNGKRTPVQLIGADWETNLAVLQLESKENLPAITTIGPDDIATGQLAILVGTAPMVSGSFATYGTMAHTSLGGDDPYNAPLYAMMTMSSIARPGAPLFDANGYLIGLLDGRMQEQNSGYWTVIPLHTIRSILPLLEKGGGIPRGYLGMIPAQPKEEGDLPGITVAQVIAGSPAERIGIKTGDYICEVNGIHTQRLSTLRIAITSQPGKNVDIEIMRNGTETILKPTLGSHVPTTNDATRDPLRKL